MTAKEYLRSLRFLDRKCDSANEHLERLRSRIYSAKAPSLSGMPRGGETMTFEQALAKLDELKDEWAVTVDEYVDQERLVKEQIAALEEERHRQVLSEHYIYKKTFEQIAFETPAGYRTICRWHGSALQEFEAVHKDFLNREQ